MNSFDRPCIKCGNPNPDMRVNDMEGGFSLCFSCAFPKQDGPGRWVRENLGEWEWVPEKSESDSRAEIREVLQILHGGLEALPSDPLEAHNCIVRAQQILWNVLARFEGKHVVLHEVSQMSDGSSDLAYTIEEGAVLRAAAVDPEAEAGPVASVPVEGL